MRSPFVVTRLIGSGTDCAKKDRMNAVTTNFLTNFLTNLDGRRGQGVARLCAQLIYQKHVTPLPSDTRPTQPLAAGGQNGVLIFGW